MATLEELELARAERGCENPPLDPNNIRKVKCKTCPFGDHPIGLELGQKAFNQLYQRLVQTALTESNQYCHAEELLGKVSTHVCRGARDIQLEYFYRMGVISESTDEAWLEALQNTSPKKSCENCIHADFLGGCTNDIWYEETQETEELNAEWIEVYGQRKF